MAPKRKSDVLDLTSDDDYKSAASAASDNETPKAPPPAAKKRKSAAGKAEASSSTAAKTWREIKIDGEDEGEVAIYDDCNEIRRKIRLLQKEPGFKVTHWLQEIGGINSNSYGRFMKATGADGGAENGTYEAAWLYFEKNRILQDKKKTPKRIRNEKEHPNGLSRRSGHRGVWVLGR